MTSHDIPVEDVKSILENDKKKSKVRQYNAALSNKHVCVYDQEYKTPNGMIHKYCECMRWEESNE